MIFCSIVSLNAKNKLDNTLKEIMKEMVIKINDFNALPKDTPQYEIERQYKELNQSIDNVVESINELPKYVISKKDKAKYSDYFKSLRSRIAKYEVSENAEIKEDALRDHQQSTVSAVKEVAVKNPTKENETSSTPKKNPNEEITLTVSSDGPTKDDAVKNALRLALEQAYGAFVSANTTILNDELVKDEIVTISTGAIKEYSIVSEVEKPDGKGFMVTTKATVSLPHLITYAKNHGSECEFAGNTFGMQMKLWELQKKNELIALKNLFSQAKAMLPSQINWTLKVEEPKFVDDFQAPEWLERKSPILFDIFKSMNPSDFCEVSLELIGHIHPEYSQSEIANMSEGFRGLKSVSAPIRSMLLQGMENISIPGEERETARRLGSHGSIEELDGFGYFEFRTSRDDFKKIWDDFMDECGIQLYDGVCIEDNTGAISNLNLLTFLTDRFKDKININMITTRLGKSHYCAVDTTSTGLFNKPFYIRFNEDGYGFNPWGSAVKRPVYFQQYKKDEWQEITDDILYRYNANNAYPVKIYLTVFIPKEEISKYSNFKVVKK